MIIFRKYEFSSCAEKNNQKERKKERKVDGQINIACRPIYAVKPTVCKMTYEYYTLGFIHYHCGPLMCDVTLHLFTISATLMADTQWSDPCVWAVEDLRKRADHINTSTVFQFELSSVESGFPLLCYSVGELHVYCGASCWNTVIKRKTASSAV